MCETKAINVMRNKILLFSFFICLSGCLISCKNDTYLSEPPSVPGQSFSEEFDTLSAASARGWTLMNASTPAGTGAWTGPSITTVIPLFSGNGYIYSFQTAVQGSSTYSVSSTLSNWIVSKPIWLHNGDKIVFYSNGVTVDQTPIGLELRMNVQNEGTNVGSGKDPGDFKDILTVINPSQTYNSPDSYPATWTKFEATVFGLAEPKKGRIAFRFYIPDNYQYNLPTTMIAIDKFSYTSNFK